MMDFLAEEMILVQTNTPGFGFFFSPTDDYPQLVFALFLVLIKKMICFWTDVFIEPPERY